jgi:TRAP transporter 4TM/12TM fusion protein
MKKQKVIDFVRAPICILFVLYHMFYVGGVLRLFNFYPTSINYRAGSLCLILMVALLFLPEKEKEGAKSPWWYYISNGLILVGMVGTFFFVVLGEQLYELYGLGEFPAYGQVLFICVVLGIVEASRRFLGLTLPLLAILFVAMPLFQSALPGIFHGKSWDLNAVSGTLLLDAYGILGSIMGIAATVIVAFVIFGTFLATSGAGDFFNDVANSLTGNFRGGPAKASIVSSALFGSLSGSPTSNVATTGSFTIPLMKKLGYKSEFAAAIEAVSSNGGQIMPPVMGIVAFIMADVTGIPYADIAIAALFPALLYYLAVFIQTDLEAVKLGLKGMDRSKLPKFGAVMKSGWPNLIPLAVLIFLLLFVKYSPARCALYSLLIVIGINLINRNKRFTWKQFLDNIVSACKMMIMPGLGCAVAGVFVSSLNLTGVGLKLAGQLVALSHGNLLLLLILTAVACYILGMGVTSIVSYIIVASTIAPALIDMGVTKMAAHFFAYYFAISSFITPPVAIAVYVAAAVAQASPMKSGIQAVKLAIVAYIVPFVFVYKPVLLLRGGFLDVIGSLITAALGVASICMAISRYAFTELVIWEVLLLFASGLMMMWPGTVTDILGLAVFAFVLITNWHRNRHQLKSC